ncbi:unnamed protein product [Orchesella dallaii]|uniref:Cytochrome P450 n=1 Tax=Orchesella dallaii TaxID=48710 RepID=A0ABP1QWZ1_9HEXA
MDWGAGLEHYFESSTIFLQMVQSRTPDEIIFKTREASLFRRLVEQNGTFFRLFVGLITLFMIWDLIKRIGFRKSLKWIRTSSSSRLSKSIDNLPGPKSSAKWFIGNALELSSSSSKDLFKTFQLWCEKYGPCFAFKIFNQNVVMLNSASMVQGHLKTDGLKIDHLLLLLLAEKWKVRRKIMAKAFTHKSLLGYAHVFNKEAKELVSELERLFPPRQNVNGWKGKQVNKLLWSCALRVICGNFSN